MAGVPQATRLLVYARAQERCEICGVYAYGGSLHHRRPRGMGGSKRPETNQASNLLLLCGSGTTGCHGTTEAARLDAIDAGRILRQGQTPADVPVLTRHGLVLLDDAGNYIPYEGAA